jgi:hypothetical protein
MLKILTSTTFHWLPTHFIQHLSASTLSTLTSAKKEDISESTRDHPRMEMGTKQDTKRRVHSPNSPLSSNPPPSTVNIHNMQIHHTAAEHKTCNMPTAGKKYHINMNHRLHNKYNITDHKT